MRCPSLGSAALTRGALAALVLVTLARGAYASFAGSLGFGRLRANVATEFAREIARTVPVPSASGSADFEYTADEETGLPTRGSRIAGELYLEHAPTVAPGHWNLLAFDQLLDFKTLDGQDL